MVELWEKIVKGEIDKEIVEMAKIEILNRWKSMGLYDENIKKIDIDDYVEKFNIEYEKKRLIKEILRIGIQKDIIISLTLLTIRLINGLIIHNLDKMSYDELTLLYKRMKTADLKKLFFTRKNHFFNWQ
jgi:hypothetical protein